MEIKSINDGLLTNVEVLELLKETRATRGKSAPNSIDLQHRESIEIETIKSITGSKISHVISSAVVDCASDIKKLDFGLTEGEIIQIVNLKPESEVEYYLIIEDCSERLNEDQMASLKSVVDATYSVPI